MLGGWLFVFVDSNGCYGCKDCLVGDVELKIVRALRAGRPFAKIIVSTWSYSKDYQKKS
jgi:hypothetical protein